MKVLKNLDIKKLILILFILLIPLHFIFFIFYSQTFENTNYLDKRSNVEDCTVSLTTINKEITDLDLVIKYADTYVFPEITNIYCLGKVKDILYNSESIEVIVYRSPRFHIALILYVGLIVLGVLFFNKYKIVDFILLFYLFLYILTIEAFQYRSFYLPITVILLLYPYYLVKNYIIYKSEGLFSNQPSAINKNLFQIGSVFSFVFLIILIERVLWTDVSVWGLDQTTHIWVGNNYSINNMPVGNISSRYLPNPNGLMIIGKLLSFFPNLKFVSVFLTLFQSAILFLIYQSVPSNKRQDFRLFFLAILSSIYLINASIEFWSQYLVLNINILFIYWVINLVNYKNPNSFTFLSLLVLLVSSFYLNGIITGGVMFVTGIYFFKRFISISKERLINQLFYTLSLLTIFIYFVWIPYFSEVSLNDFFGFERTHTDAWYIILFESLIRFPINFLFQWAEVDSYKASLLMFAEPNNILSIRSRYLQFTNLALHALFGLSFLVQIIYVFVRKLKTKENNLKQILKILLSFIFVSYIIFPLLGSFKLGNNENPSLSLQYYPIYLLIIFILPLLFKSEKLFNNIFLPINKFLFSVFIILNLSLSHSVFTDHMKYDDFRITNADVPYSNKIDAIEFIVQDWSKYSDSNEIPVFYDFDKVSFYSWITEFGFYINEWYEAPFTLGREYDYELLKRYGLQNSQEGIQIRTIENNRYIISYYYLEPPEFDNNQVEHYKIGRLRVSIVSY